MALRHPCVDARPRDEAGADKTDLLCVHLVYLRLKFRDSSQFRGLPRHSEAAADPFAVLFVCIRGLSHDFRLNS